MSVSIIVAVSQNDVIGKDNDLIWHISADLKRFKRLTTGHTIIMGRKTYESIGRPLPNRKTVIITRQKDYTAQGCDVVFSLEEALALDFEGNEQFIIGGGSIYAESIDLADKIYLTKVHEEFEGDTFFPKLNLDNWIEESKEIHEVDEKCKHRYTFIDYIKK